MKKLSKHIALSTVVSSLVFSPALALPNGGKFTHGTSGSISTNGNTMNITGNGKNSVIQWGGGFSIGEKEQVNFNGSNKNYLNIAHGASKSFIKGTLDGGNNNVFLINPNGVRIEKGGQVINTNRFVASTSSIRNEDMTKFANMQKFEDGLSFSPVFKPNKLGNVVNMGNINANNVLLIGNKVNIQGGKIGNANSTTHLVGNEVYIDADAVKLNSNKINVTALKEGYIQRQMNNFVNDNYSFGSSSGIVQVVDYQETDGKLHIGKVDKFKKMLTIGNMGSEKDNAIEWKQLVNGWNDNLGETRNINEFQLVGNIDFDWQLIDPIGYKDFFTANFNGNGFSLKNILISAHGSAGLFGKIENSNISNMDINGLKFQYSGKLPSTIGGFVSYAKNSNISNINLNNIGEIKGTNQVGGFIGYGKTNDISNITLSNVQGLYIGNNTSNIATIGGFIGSSSFSNYNNITLNNIGDMTMENSWRDIFQSSIGWFVGRSDQIDNISNPAYTPNTFNNIIINNVGNMYITGRYNYSHTLYAGGFAGVLFSYTNVVDKFNNIYINFGENSEIIVNGDFKKSYIGKFTGTWNEGSYDFNNIHIYHKQGLLSNATSDVWLSNDFDTNGYMQDKINIHTNENSFITDVLNNEDLKQVGLYLDENGNLSFYKKIIQDPNKPESGNSQAILGSDDLLTEDLLNQILADLKNNNYEININTLKDIIINLKALGANSTQEQKANFLATYLLGANPDKFEGDKLKLAYSILQSIEFIEAYKDNDFSNASFENANLKDLVAKFQAQSLLTYNNTIANSKKFNKFIYDTSKKVDTINTANENLDKLEANIKTLANKYNDYVALINQGLASKDDLAFKLLQTQLFALINQAKGDLDMTKDLVNAFNTMQANINSNYDYFTLSGNLKANIISFPILDAINNNGTNPEIPDKPVDPVDPIEPINPVDPIYPEDVNKPDQLFSQVSVLDSEDEEANIDEAATEQRLKTCIVSDNFKVMNPCVVQSM